MSKLLDQKDTLHDYPYKHTAPPPPMLLRRERDGKCHVGAMILMSQTTSQQQSYL